VIQTEPLNKTFRRAIGAGSQTKTYAGIVVGTPDTDGTCRVRISGEATQVCKVLGDGTLRRGQPVVVARFPGNSMPVVQTSSAISESGISSALPLAISTSMVAHELSSEFHTGQLSPTQATWAATLDGTRPFTGPITINPPTAEAPIVIGANGQGQKVIGLNADLLDGLDSSAFSLSSHNHDSVYALRSLALTAGAGLTGGGDLTTGRTFAVGAGAGITVNADDVALTTPGTIGVSTSNLSTGNHTHLIDFSFSPGVASKILATNSLGQFTMTGKITAMGGVYLGSQPGHDNDAISRLYMTAKGMNLASNGTGLLGSNYNFSSLTFDASDTHGGGGSFKSTFGQTVMSDEFIAVDATRYYRGAEWLKNGDQNGTNYNSGAGHYAGLACYDIDKYIITPNFVMKFTGSVNTTLAQALNPGDTVMVLTNAAGWQNSTAYPADHKQDGYSRQINWWPYTNTFGYSYPTYTYSRNWSGSQAIYNTTTVGMWDSGGISGNTITLTAPWGGPALAVGTPVRNSSQGGTYVYFIASNVKPAQNVWTRYEGIVSPMADATVGWPAGNVIMPGTAFVKLLFLMNYSGYSTNNQRISDIWFSEMSSRNIEEASATVPGIITTTTQTFAGLKTFGDGLTISAGKNLTVSGSVASHLTPSLTDTYNLGSSTKLWRKGWLSELDAVVFAENTISLLGGWLYITKDQGVLGADVLAADTTINFGKAMTENFFVVMRASGKVEYFMVGTLVSGTTYNVTRNLDGSGANDWPMGTPFAVLGRGGDGRIELNAYDTPRLSMIVMNEIFEDYRDYNQQSEIIRLGDLNGMPGVSTETWGIYIGDASNYLKYDGTALTIAGNGAGLTSITGGNITTGSITGAQISLTSYLSINSNTWGSDGVQLQYNGGNPRAYIGNGTNRYFQFDGTDVSWAGANTSLTAAGVFTASSAVITGQITATSGSLSGLSVSGLLTLSGSGKLITAASPAARIELSTTELAGYSDATTRQFYISATDGKAYAGGDKVTLGASGLAMAIPDSVFWAQNSSLSFTSSGAPVVVFSAWRDIISSPNVFTAGLLNSSPTGTSATVNIEATSDTYAQILLRSTKGAIAPAAIFINNDGATTDIRIEASHTTATGGLNVGAATGATAGDMAYSGHLRPYRNSSLLTAYAFVPITPVDLSDGANTWNGTLNNLATGTYTFNLQAVANGLPAGIKAVVLLLNGSWAAAGASNQASARPAGGSVNHMIIRAQAAAIADVSQGVVAVGTNDDIEIVVAGAAMSTCVARILGYFI
jgi:hypothetical protein